MANDSRRRNTGYGAPAPKSRPKRSGKGLVIALIVIVAAVVGVLIWYFASHQSIGQEALNAGVQPTPAAANAVSQLPDNGEAPEPAQFDFEINDNPIFSSSIGKGDLGIANPRHNYYTMHVEIIEDGTGDSLYSSGTLLPGEQIEEDSLMKALAKGDHAATARIYAYDPETGSKVVDTSAGLTITVK